MNRLVVDNLSDTWVAYEPFAHTQYASRSCRLQIRLFQESARQLPRDRSVLFRYSDETLTECPTNPFEKRLLISSDQNGRTFKPEQRGNRFSLIEFAHEPRRPLRHHRKTVSRSNAIEHKHRIVIAQNCPSALTVRSSIRVVYCG